MSDDGPDASGAEEADRSAGDVAGDETGGAAGETVAPVDPSSASTRPPAPADGDTDADGTLGLRIRQFLNYGLLAGLLIVALVAVVGLYTAVSSAISIWVAREWRPLFRAAFNLVVLLLAGSGIVWQAARMR